MSCGAATEMARSQMLARKRGSLGTDVTGPLWETITTMTVRWTFSYPDWTLFSLKTHAKRNSLLANPGIKIQSKTTPVLLSRTSTMTDGWIWRPHILVRVWPRCRFGITITERVFVQCRSRRLILTLLSA